MAQFTAHQPRLRQQIVVCLITSQNRHTSGTRRVKMASLGAKLMENTLAAASAGLAYTKRFTVPTRYAHSSHGWRSLLPHTVTTGNLSAGTAPRTSWVVSPMESTCIAVIAVAPN